ncbi:MAG: hypothetical protein HS117_19530 [Verrucomicrobiaceae bacterium]|nr:hypothetical protein [Verrucomicrobiaceae bacterium]
MATESDIHPGDLVSAVAHWLELEQLFGRERLLNESSLKLPIHQFLASNAKLDLDLEVPYPGLPSGAGQAIDFCLKRWKAITATPAAAPAAAPAATPAATPATTPAAWVHVIESKFVTDKRSFQQEVFDDLVRLEWVEKSGQSEPLCRWLIVAGRKAHMKNRIFSVQTNPGSGSQRVNTFDHILGKTIGVKLNVRVADETRSGFRMKWSKSAKDLGLKKWPLSFDTKLCGKGETTNFECYLWRVLSVANRALKDIT